MSTKAVKMAADVKWCSTCNAGGIKSRIRILQIDQQEAALICEKKDCTTNLTSTKVLPQSVSQIAADKHKRQRRDFGSSPSNPLSNQMSPTSCDLIQHHLPNGIPGSTNTGTVPQQSQLKTQLWEGDVHQWLNKDALCWLDVSMCALVHCTSLRLCLRRLGEASLLHELCSEFDRAQRVENEDGVSNDGHISRTDHDRLNHNKTLTNSSKNNPSHSFARPNNLDSSLPMNHFDAEAALEWLVMSDEDAAKHKEMFLAGKSNELETEVCETKQSAQDILDGIRMRLWEALKKKLGCELGKEESPVFALPLLARLSGAVEEHFVTRYRWEFFCSACKYTNMTTFKKTVVSFTTLAPNFHLSSPAMVKTCPACKSPNQSNYLEYHSCPSCMMFHFTDGINNPDVTSYNFTNEFGTYEVSCIIQYISGNEGQDHFIAWIRDVHRDMWLKCNDLELTTCQWESQVPSIPSSEIHIVIMERQGDPCTACDMFNSATHRIRNNVDQIVDKLTTLNGTYRKVNVASAKRTNGVNNYGNINVATAKRTNSVNTSGNTNVVPAKRTNGVNNYGNINVVPAKRTNGVNNYGNINVATAKRTNSVNTSGNTNVVPAKQSNVVSNPGNVNKPLGTLDKRSAPKLNNEVLQQKPSSYQSYFNGLKKDQLAVIGGLKRDQTATIDMEVTDKESDDVDKKASSESSGIGTDESWSRSPSPVTVSSSSTRKRRFPPNYLYVPSSQDSTFTISKTALIKRNQNKTKGDVPSQDTQEQNMDTASVSFGNSNVYSRKNRSSRKNPNKNYPGRKKSFPSYSETLARKNSIPSSQSFKAGHIHQIPDATLAASLPEGAFMRYSPWQSKGSSEKSSDRSTNSSPSDLQRGSKLTSSNLPRPRCESLSSVSSPSACSDLSSLSDNSSTIHSTKDDICSSIDELYKALEINNSVLNSQPRIPSPTFDDDFLAEILADDPVPATMPPTQDRWTEVKVSFDETKMTKDGFKGAQGFIEMSPSMEPMASDVLAKFVS